MTKRWVFAEEPEEAVVDVLKKEININPVLASILANRGIRTYDAARSFFRPQLDELHDPFLMKDMDIAVERLVKAIDGKEKILVYGDYDVDGTTSVALVYEFLQDLSPDIVFYLPDRYSEGYGISKNGIEFAVEKKVDLIIALDCGIRANNMIQMAVDNSIDVIICDHHIPGDELPPAVAVLDPKQANCSYPFDELSGCGIGFKLLEGYCQKCDVPKRKLYAGLDLVAVSISADIVPIVDENRILAYWGLKKLNLKPRPGLKALMKISGRKSNIDVSGVVFGIAPKINAAGRIHHANGAVRLLLSDDEEKADELSKSIQDQNQQRRDLDEDITSSALQMIEKDVDYMKAKSTVLFSNEWHKGVIGIVASRLIEKFYRPTIVLTESGGKATGSARSVDGFNIYNAINSCSETLEQFGGHAFAAGLTLPIDKVDQFKTDFERIVQSTITDDQLVPKVKVDSILDFDMINHKFFNVLSQMAPFGPKNPSPLFVTENVSCSRTKIMKELHLKMWLRQGDSKKTMEAIAFGMADLHPQISTGQPFMIAYHLEENEYNGEKTIQIVVKDIKTEKEHGVNTEG